MSSLRQMVANSGVASREQAKMPHCAAIGCNFESKRNKGSGISLHIFPRDGKLREFWESACGREKLPKDRRLCSRHFTEDDFEDLHRLRLFKELTGTYFKRRLKPGAVPTVFPHKEPKSPGETSEKRKKFMDQRRERRSDSDTSSDTDEPRDMDTDMSKQETDSVQPNTTSELGMDTMPVDRMRMRPWLEEQIDSCQIPGLKWVNKGERIFQIRWLHGAHQNWDLEKDAPLFMRWAIHTGKYRPGVERPNPRMWKSNFRCALNSLPDIVEVKDKHIKRGSNAFRVYKMLSSKGSACKALKRINKRMNVKVSGSEQFIPEDGPTDFTKPDLTRVKQESSEETDSAEDFDVKDEPDDIPIREEAGFVKPEEEDFPCTVVTVRIGENGKVEETDEPVFSLDPQIHFKSYGQKLNDSKSAVNSFPVKPKPHRKPVQGSNTYEVDDRKRKRAAKTPFRFGEGETSGEASGLTTSMP